MRNISMLIMLGVAIAGCASSDEDKPEGEKQSQSSDPRGPLVGSYYQGDGLGFNLRLTLKEKGDFDCLWTGCLGVYGSTSGTWSLLGDKITVRVMESKDMFEDHAFGNMRVIKHEGKTRLLFDKDAQDVKENPRMLEYLSFGLIELEEDQPED